MKVKLEVQEMVEFRSLNLNNSLYAVEGPYDVILCRNVLIYFSAESRERLVPNLVNHLVPGGFLFVGHAENLSSFSAQLRSIEPTIYVNKSTSPGNHFLRDSSTSKDPERQQAIGASTGR